MTQGLLFIDYINNLIYNGFAYWHDCDIEKLVTKQCGIL
jgi:hypothetical protein